LGDQITERKAFALVRYNADGSLDETFAEKGKLLYPINEFDSHSRAIALLPDGGILVGGSSRTEANGIESFTLLKLDKSGAPSPF
jgi:hypothetical protein